MHMYQFAPHCLTRIFGRKEISLVFFVKYNWHYSTHSRCIHFHIGQEKSFYGSGYYRWLLECSSKESSLNMAAKQVMFVFVSNIHYVIRKKCQYIHVVFTCVHLDMLEVLYKKTKMESCIFESKLGSLNKSSSEPEQKLLRTVIGCYHGYHFMAVSCVACYMLNSILLSFEK